MKIVLIKIFYQKNKFLFIFFIFFIINIYNIMSGIDYYSKYKKYKGKYLYLQYGGVFEENLNKIVNKFKEKSKDIIIDLLKKHDKEKKIYNLLVTLKPLSDEKKIKEELKKQINVVKELIGKLIDKLPLDMMTKPAIKLALKGIYSTLNTDVLISTLKPIIDITLDGFKNINQADLNKLK